MQLRRRIALLSSALVITAPVLSACGFDRATDRENSTIAGANNRTGSVDVLNATLVTTENGSARLVATFSNNAPKKPATVTGISAASDADVTISGFKPIELEPYGMVAPKKSDAEILVEGDVERGGHVRLIFSFADGTESMVNVPVMAAWEEYKGWGPGGSGEQRPEFVGPRSEHGAGHGEESSEESGHAEGDAATDEASAH